MATPEGSAANPINVAGSLTTTPSGTQNVAITGAPPGTDLTASATGVASAATATLAAAAGKFTYITGFEVTGGGATVGSLISVTVTGVVTGTLTYVFAVPTGATGGATPLIVEFSRPIPSSAVNTAIAVVVPSFGAGNTNSAVVAHGF